MKDKEWLLESVDNPQVNWIQHPVEFMLSHSLKDPPEGDFVYEVKWDGIRVMIAIDEGEITIRSRNQRDITAQFPELCIPEEAFRATSALFDGEVVCLDDSGRPVFKKVINRLMQSTEGGINKGKARNPAFCYLFDCLYLDGRPIVNEPLMKRREGLIDSVKKDTPYRVSEMIEDGKELFEAAKKLELEGIMAKDPAGKYYPGKRSSSWYKVKVRQTADCVIIGYSEGKGDRKQYFGALQIAQLVDGNLEYRGKVGTGWDANMMKSIFGELQKIEIINKPINEKLMDEASTTWIESMLFCEIQYAQLTKNHIYREPVFLRLRPDLVLK